MSGVSVLSYSPGSGISHVFHCISFYGGDPFWTVKDGPFVHLVLCRDWKRCPTDLGHFLGGSSKELDLKVSGVPCIRTGPTVKRQIRHTESTTFFTNRTIQSLC